MAGSAGGLHRPAGRAAIKGKGDDETLLQGRTVCGPVVCRGSLCEYKPIDMVRKWVYTIPNTRKGAQADEIYSRCPAQAARANALLPDKFPADRLKKQEDAVVWEKYPNIHRHNKRRIDNG